MGSHVRRAGVLRRTPDRKSTRLNSSHVEISYAVFCLHAHPELYPLSLHDALPISGTPADPLRGSGRNGAGAIFGAASPSRRRRWSAPTSQGCVVEVQTRRTNGESRSPSRCPETNTRSEEHTSELQSRRDLVCRLLLARAPRALPPFPTRRSSDLGHTGRPAEGVGSERRRRNFRCCLPLETSALERADVPRVRRGGADPPNEWGVTFAEPVS